jgi:hypothetical protein
VSQLNDDPEHWRKRAEGMRAIANAMTGMARAKESILRIAEKYDQKALRRRASAASLVEKKMASNPKQPAGSPSPMIGLTGKMHQRSPEG